MIEFVQYQTKLTHLSNLTADRVMAKQKSTSSTARYYMAINGGANYSRRINNEQ